MERSPTTAGQQATAGAPKAGADGEVRRFIAMGKCKQAVELAKDLHKKQNTPQSQALLIDAYISRIEQFQKKGCNQDAQTLIKLVCERFPVARSRLMAVEMRVAAGSGHVESLVAPLAKADTPESLRVEIETALRRQLVDLPQLANCAALPADHPLRIAAAATWRAFEAVTKGAVTEEQIALMEVSRRSPLAGWKMLIRALAAFYRHDDEDSRRALEGVPPDAAVAHLVPVLLATIDQKPLRSGVAKAMQSRVIGDDKPLRTALEKIEEAISYCDSDVLRRAAIQAMNACAQCRPEMGQRLRQHIFSRCVAIHAPMDEVVGAIGASLKNAHYWRMIALACEGDRGGEAAVYWEQFRRHGIHEGIIKPGSMEEAVVHLRAAVQLTRVSPRDLARLLRQLQDTQSLVTAYDGQPSEVAALRPPSSVEFVQNFTNAAWCFARAAEIDGNPATFQQWRAWVRESLGDRYEEDVARTWHAKRPGDPQPLVILSALAEKRNALKLALKWLTQAEAIDALNPEVRKARLRLTLSTAWRHLKDSKAHLVEQDLAELEQLPAMADGDRPAVLWSLRSAWHALLGEQAEAQSACDKAIDQFGPLAAGVIMDYVASKARLESRESWPVVPGVALPEPRAVAEAEARCIRLGRDLELTPMRPEAGMR